MITRILNYLCHGSEVDRFVDLANPHTVEKLAIGQARMQADLWSCVGHRYSRDRVVEQRERKAARVKASVTPFRRQA